MSAAPIREPASFGKRATTHTITVTRNGKSRQFNINPIVFSIVACFAFVFMIGYFGATAYLVFRDDLVAASYAKHARMKHEYEDRIAALRSKLDHITSRQLLDQQAIETRVQELMQRQNIIGARGNALGEVMQKAEARGISPTTVTRGLVPVPTVNPVKGPAIVDTVITGSLEQKAQLDSPQFASAFSLNGSYDEVSAYATEVPVAGNFTDRLFGEVSDSINIIEAQQKRRIDAMRITANERSGRLASALKGLGIQARAPQQSNIGGPFVPLDEDSSFEVFVQALEDSLSQYDSLSAKARSLPLAYPVKNPKISSRYGSRIDPFNGRSAMHSGVDFKAPTGTPVYSTGYGKVIKAGRKGGYGKVVEVEHPGGLVTRYAHLSRIKVKVGQRVSAGSVIGKVGSTGRSTGPHLHYEVRAGKKARNPSKFMKIGRKIQDLL